MMTDDTHDLLRDYTRHRSEDAFRTLVRQHSPVVYGTALRKLGGNRAAAQDVTQEVFTLLARKADRLGAVVLGGWLYRQTCRLAANHVRTESRRKRRESFAMENLSIDSAADEPINESLTEELDDALLALPQKDRDALILRFFENKEFKVLGTTLGLSEEAARKRVARALERLTGNLKRKGIAVGTVSLGTAMQSFGTTPVPAAVISKVSENALSAGAGGWSLSLALLKPVVAGIVATSLIAGSTLALRPGKSNSSLASTRPPPATTRNPRPPRFAEKLPEHPTLEQIIAEIRRIRSGPGNALTELRLKVALGKVGIKQIPDFIALGNKQLDTDEQFAIYRPLLGSWWQQEHEKALDFMVKMLEGPQIAPDTFFVRSSFAKWASEDPGSSHNWLFSHWDDPLLKTPAFQDTLRGDLAKGEVSRMFGRGEIDAIFQFVSRIPQVTDQAEALEPVAGRTDTHGIWNYSDDRKDQWRQVYQGLEKIPDAKCRMELTRSFWKKVSENSPNEIAGIQSFIAPSDPFVVSLGWLSVVNLPSERTENMAGGQTIRYQQVTDLEARVQAATDAGLKAGLSPQAVKDAITDTLRKRGGEDVTAWFEKDNPSKGPDSNLRMSRGTFRRLLYRSPEEALNYLNDASLLPEQKQEFQIIASGTP